MCWAGSLRGSRAFVPHVHAFVCWAGVVLEAPALLVLVSWATLLVRICVAPCRFILSTLCRLPLVLGRVVFRRLPRFCCCMLFVFGVRAVVILSSASTCVVHLPLRSMLSHHSLHSICARPGRSLEGSRAFVCVMLFVCVVSGPSTLTTLCSCSCHHRLRPLQALPELALSLLLSGCGGWPRYRPQCCRCRASLASSVALHHLCRRSFCIPFVLGQGGL